MSSATIHDIAKRVGLNSSTVSRALRGNPCVKEATRERILRIADELGYVPDLNARNLADGKTRRIAFLMNSLYNGIEVEPASVVNRILDEAGYTTMLLLSSGSRDIFMRHLTQMAQKLCDAALIIPAFGENEPEVIRLIESLRIPVIFIDRWPEKASFPVVTTDHKLAMERLFECAEKENYDASFVLLADSNSASRSRHCALMAKLKKQNKPFFSEKEELRKWILKNPEATLCLFTNGVPEPDFFADIPRPKKWIACGFDNITPESAMYYGTVYLCVQDFSMIAKQAASMLLDLLQGKKLKRRICAVPPLEIRKIGG